MKILLLAPQPFYQERGTPIAVDLVLRTLSTRGDEVDVLAYHEGAPVLYPNVHVHRIIRLPFVRRVGPGPSWKKLLCDAVLFVKALRMAARTRYDLVHAVEESVFMAMVIKKCFGIPYLYDMDSSLAEQVTDKYRVLGFLGSLFRWLEGLAVRRAEAVVPVCDALAEIAQRQRPNRLVVLRDISLLSVNGREQTSKGLAESDVRPALGLSGPIVMYIGNLERYQGIDLLLESFAIARRRVPEAHLVVIGGQPESLQRYHAMAKRLGLNGSAHFLGPRPVAQLASYLAAADVLVSPRLAGGNTPMKVYSYLHSGKAVLATDLPTHTQVLNETVAVLRSPRPEPFAEGLVQLLQDPSLRQRLGRSGQALIEARHSYRTFQATLMDLYDGLHERAASPRRAATGASKRRVWAVTMQIVSWLLRAAASAFLLWVVLRKVNIADVGEFVRGIRWGWIAAGFAGLVINRWLACARMIALVRAKGLPCDPETVAQIVLGSQFYGQFLPTSVGGDVLRVYSLSRHTDNTTESASAVMMERALGVVALLLMGLAGSLWAWPRLQDHRILWAALIPSSVGLIVGRVALSERRVVELTRWLNLHGHRWAKKPMQWLKAIHAYRHHQREVNQVLMMSMGMHFFRVVAAYCAARAMGSTLSFVYFAGFVPLILLTTQLPISIGGWGVRENVYVHCFRQAGMDPALAFSVSVVSHLMQVIATMPGGIWVVWNRRGSRRAASVSPATGRPPAVAAECAGDRQP